MQLDQNSRKKTNSQQIHATHKQEFKDDQEQVYMNLLWG